MKKKKKQCTLVTPLDHDNPSALTGLENVTARRDKSLFHKSFRRSQHQSVTIGLRRDEVWNLMVCRVQLPVVPSDFSDTFRL